MTRPTTAGLSRPGSTNLPRAFVSIPASGSCCNAELVPRSSVATTCWPSPFPPRMWWGPSERSEPGRVRAWPAMLRGPGRRSEVFDVFCEPWYGRRPLSSITGVQLRGGRVLFELREPSRPPGESLLIWDTVYPHPQSAAAPIARSGRACTGRGGGLGLRPASCRRDRHPPPRGIIRVQARPDLEMLSSTPRAPRCSGSN